MFSFGLFRHPKGLKDISPAELRRLAHESDRLRIVDVRRPHEYQQGHIEGAVSAPLGTTAKAVRSWPHDTPIALVCLSGHRSQAAAVELLGMGFSDVSHLAGGMLAWHRAGLPMKR